MSATILPFPKSMRISPNSMVFHPKFGYVSVVETRDSTCIVAWTEVLTEHPADEDSWLTTSDGTSTAHHEREVATNELSPIGIPKQATPATVISFGAKNLPSRTA